MGECGAWQLKNLFFWIWIEISLCTIYIFTLLSSFNCSTNEIVIFLRIEGTLRQMETWGKVRAEKTLPKSFPCFSFFRKFWMDVRLDHTLMGPLEKILICFQTKWLPFWKVIRVNSLYNTTEALTPSAQWGKIFPLITHPKYPSDITVGVTRRNSYSPSHFRASLMAFISPVPLLPASSPSLSPWQICCLLRCRKFGS